MLAEPTSADQLMPPDALLDRLVSDGVLTQFQAQTILDGRGEQLLLGEYLLLEQIGRGGMGCVYRARHRRMKRTVAIKLLSPEATANEEAVRRFHREVEAAARLVHPSVVTAYDAGEAHGQRFLVMEYVAGHDLAKYLAQQGPMPVRIAVDFVLQAARALEYAHSQGVIHRDVKPSNLLVDAAGNLKVLDLGLARFDDSLSTADPATEDLTHTRQVMGTADYMSPEQAVNTKYADQRSDIYSLGCTLYRLLVGRGPYGGETVIEKILAHRERPIPSLTESRSSVTPELEATYGQMVAKRPEERYASMTEVVVALEQIIPGLPVDEAPMEISSHGLSGTMSPPSLEATQPAGVPGSEETNAYSPHNPDEPPHRSTPNRRKLLLAGGSLLLLGGPLAIWAWLKRDRSASESIRRGGIDLLSQIDPKRDAVDGDWQLLDGELVGGVEDRRPVKLLRPPELRSRLRIPYQLPAQYDLAMTVERLSGLGPLTIGLATPSSQFLVILARELSGVEQADRRIRPANDIRPGDDGLAINEPAEIVCRVRSDGVEVDVNGRPIVRWQGETDELTLPPAWSIGDPASSFLGCIRSRFKFTRMELRQTDDRQLKGTTHTP